MTSSSTPGAKDHRLWLVLLIFLLLAGSAYQWGPQLWSVVQDRQALDAFVEQLGWLGPIALILFNTLQIVIAPIPGYAVQGTAGFLYGPFWGGVWGGLGLLCGSMLAMWLARAYGRPVAARLVGDERLSRWENISYGSNVLVWVVLLLGPTGDVPYFLAGLSKISFMKMALVTLFVRVPSAFVTAAIGSGALFLSWWQVACILGLLGIAFLAFMRYHEPIMNWVQRQTQRQVMMRNSGG